LPPHSVDDRILEKIEMHAHSIGLNYAHRPFVKIDQMVNIKPAMAAGMMDSLGEIGDFVAPLEDGDHL
jgi:hypothetical protein